MEDPQDDGLHELEEAAELQELVARVLASRGRDAAVVLPRYKQILTKYQEQPQLLDGCLEAIVQPLAALLRDHAAAAAPPAGGAGAAAAAGAAGEVCGVCRLLHVLVSVRGHKTVVRFFPHEAADLERALQVLLDVRAASERGAAAAMAAGVAGPGCEDAPLALWEAQSVLLLWLSILILTPFDLRTVDSAVGAECTDGGGGGGVTPLAARIIELCQGYLDHPGTAREMAALLLARLLTRPDMGPALQGFLAWQEAALAAAPPAKLQFLLPGVLQALALAFKLGRRPALLPHAPGVWAQLGALWEEAEGGAGGGGAAAPAAACLGGSSLARRLSVKLAQRLGLTLLAPRLARWRYVRQQRATLLGGAAAAADPGSNAGVAGGGDDAIEVVEEVEDILGCLLGALRDRDTAVRWCAAKGAARLAGCLPADLGGEVVDSVMGLFGPAESDTAWHGGCLALAELARRSLLLPARLPAVAPVVAAALAYDVRRGPHSVGAHVRDAAAYVCWAFARAYDPEHLGERFLGLAGPLLTAAVYDREVHVRRAAASAFQEAVGRLGGCLPHGLDLLGVVDCYSVANMAAAYLRAAPQVAAFPEHRGALLSHLLSAKLRHWDKPTRALAARALAALAPAAGAPWVAAAALPPLLARVTDDALEARSGAVLGAAELLPALADAGVADLDAAAAAAVAEIIAAEGGDGGAAAGEGAGGGAGGLAARVAGVLPALAAAQLYRGKGGELMREAAARLADCTAQAAGGLRRVHASETGSRPPSADEGAAAPDAAAGDAAAPPAAPAAAGGGPPRLRRTGAPRLALPLGPAYHSAALSLIEDCLCHTLASIRAAGAAALASHARAHGGCGAARAEVDALLDRCLARLTDPNVAHRRGAAEALGAAPAALLLRPRPARAASVLRALCAAAAPEALPLDQRDVEARVTAVEALGRLTAELCGGSGGGGGEGEDSGDGGDGAEVVAELLASQVLPVLLGALRDYTTDNRGDVGSWARGAAMEALGVALPLALAGGGGAQGPQQQQQQQREQQQGGGQEGQAAGGAARLAAAAVGEMLRIGVERIARLREAAALHLRALLAVPAVRAVVPNAAAVEAALPTDAVDAAGVASLAAVDRLAALLDAPAYSARVLEGLVASIGGVDAVLSKAAAAALLRRLDDARGGGGGGGGGAAARLPAELILLWERERACESSRLSLPLLRAAHLLLTAGDAADAPVPAAAPAPAAAPPPCDAAQTPDKPLGGEQQAAAAALPQKQGADCAAAPFAVRALELARAELRGCGDVPRLLEGAALVGALAGAGAGGAGYGALQSAAALLVSRYPRVRRHMAEQLYLALLSADAGDDDMLDDDLDEEGGDEGEGEGGKEAAGGGAAAAAACGGGGGAEGWRLPGAGAGLEEAMDVLLTSRWDGPLDGARAARGRLAELLGVEVRARAAGAGGADGGGGAAARAAAAAAAGRRDEYLSYQSLLDDAARGGGY
ncbi:MAG: armadillo-type protein [Monoraphidium minutum]|nr:MAG: armadillo-type protein [Monoraphidium minutum]